MPTSRPSCATLGSLNSAARVKLLANVTIAEFVYTTLLRPRLLRRAANAAIRVSLPERIRVGGAIVWLNPDDPVVSGALTFGMYERGEIAFFRSRFGADMTLVDIGANVGLYSALALSTPGFRGRVHCILMTEFWPYGLSRCGANGLEYLEMLQDLGLRLYELSGSRGVLAPVSSPRALVERTHGRRYANLVGMKGSLATG